MSATKRVGVHGVACDRCNGEGFVRPAKKDDWPEVCPVCGGKKIITYYRIAKWCGSDLRTVRACDALQAKGRGSARILEGIVGIAELGGGGANG
jgi:DnaJ-class molecular chaperone